MESPQSILSRLNIRGTTDTGGGSEYENFLVKLNGSGIIPNSALPIAGGVGDSNTVVTHAYGGMTAVLLQDSLEYLVDTKISADDLLVHTDDLANPHEVTATQIGLSNVVNVDTSIASNISSGTLSNARLSSDVTLLGNSFNGNDELVQLNGSGQLPSIDGSNLQNLTAANIVGTIDGAILPSTLPAKDGSLLTALNASQLTSGTIPGARFPGTLPAASGVNLTALPAGNLTGTIPDSCIPNPLPAVDGSALTNLNAASITGTITANGSGITHLNASDLVTGTVASGRLDGSGATGVTKQGNTFNGASQLVQLDGSGRLTQLILIPSTPSTSAATGTTGQIAVDSSYIYICVATNTWKRAAASTW